MVDGRMAHFRSVFTVKQGLVHAVHTAMTGADNKGHPHRFLHGRGFSELAVRPVHIAVVTEKDKVSIIRKSQPV